MKWDNVTPAMAAIREAEARKVEGKRSVKVRGKSGAPVTLPKVGGVDYTVPGDSAHWTDFQDELLKRMTAEKLSVDIMARVLDKAKSNVSGRLVFLGCARPVADQSACAAPKHVRTKWGG